MYVCNMYYTTAVSEFLKIYNVNKMHFPIFSVQISNQIYSFQFSSSVKIIILLTNFFLETGNDFSSKNSLKIDNDLGNPDFHASLNFFHQTSNNVEKLSHVISCKFIMPLIVLCIIDEATSNCGLYLQQLLSSSHHIPLQLKRLTKKHFQHSNLLACPTVTGPISALSHLFILILDCTQKLMTIKKYV